MTVQSSDLGRSLLEFHSQEPVRLKRLGYSLIALSAFAFIFALISTRGGQFVSSLIGLVALGGGVALMLIKPRFEAFTVRVFEEGFTILRNGEEHDVNWSEVEEIYQNVKRILRGGRFAGKESIYTLNTYDGRQIVFDNSVRGITDLGSALQEGVRKTMLPQALAKMREGTGASFGPITFKLHGLVEGGAYVSWIDFKRYVIDRGILNVYGQQANTPVIHIRTSMIPNLVVLLELIKRRTEIINEYNYRQRTSS